MTLATPVWPDRGALVAAAEALDGSQPVAQRTTLETGSINGKHHIDTEQRMVLGSAMPHAVNSDCTRYDSVSNLKYAPDPLDRTTRQVPAAVGYEKRKGRT